MTQDGQDASRERIAAGIARAKRDAARQRAASRVPGRVRWIVVFSWGALCAAVVLTYCVGV